MILRSINPATGEQVAEYRQPTDHEVTVILEAAGRAAEEWRRTTFEERAEAMRRVAALLRGNAARYATLMAIEMGKPVAQGRAEAKKCAWVCEYYADRAEGFLAPELVETDASKSYVAFSPLGVILAVMPWNFPFWQVLRFAAPALMAGNAGILKHAGNVTGCAFAIEELFREAGFPETLFQVIAVSSDRVAGLVGAPEVCAVTLTGSGAAGRAVAEVAGSYLKKTVLELGGSDPYVILEDADLDLAVEACVTARLINSGQSCIAAKRFIVVDAVRDAFEERFVAAMREKRTGNPLDEHVDLGPLARPDLRDELHMQVQQSVALGARVALGGTLPAGPGAFYPPSILTHVGRGMAAFDDELFGPVAAIIGVKTEREAIDAANASCFGLGAAVFTTDVDRGEAIARDELDAGACFVNAFVKSDPRLPFGGIKESGYGRELGSFGIREFVNVKTIYIR